MEQEVKVRRLCPSQACQAGFDEVTRQDCARCNGQGYLYEWVSIETLLNKEVNL